MPTKYRLQQITNYMFLKTFNYWEASYPIIFSKFVFGGQTWVSGAAIRRPVKYFRRPWKFEGFRFPINHLIIN